MPAAAAAGAGAGALQLVTQEQIEAARSGLAAKVAGDAEAAFEAEKARVADARRAELEAQLAAAAEAAAAAAAEAEVGGPRGDLTAWLVLGASKEGVQLRRPGAVPLCSGPQPLHMPHPLGQFCHCCDV